MSIIILLFWFDTVEVGVGGGYALVEAALLPLVKSPGLKLLLLLAAPEASLSSRWMSSGRGGSAVEGRPWSDGGCEVMMASELPCAGGGVEAIIANGRGDVLGRRNDLCYDKRESGQ